MRRALLVLALCLGPDSVLRAAPAPDGMVAAAEPQAVEAGLAMLRAGGSAVDAAVAVQAMLTLVEPQSSGIGGGAFLVAYDAATHAVTTYDGRETAPLSARPDLFLGPDGRPLSDDEAGAGGRAVGVPGALAMLELAHRDHGRLPWARLFQPAIAAAEAGFQVPPRMAHDAVAETRLLEQQPAARDYLLPSGAPVRAGAILHNPALAGTLRQVASGGAAALLQGPIGTAIIEAVRNGPAPGGMAMADLAAYRPVRRDPVCTAYRGVKICGMGPPSSGGIAISQASEMLEHFDLAPLNPAGADAAQLVIEAERLAMADRDLYVADPDRITIPQSGLLDPAYAAIRAQLIDIDHAMQAVRAGNPGWNGPLAAPQLAQPEHGTSQITIIDRAGNALSMTTSINSIFGSGLMAGGFMLNDQLTDFSLIPAVNGRPVANRVEPGKRPRSSMSPSLLLDRSGRLQAALGSPGGEHIIGYVLQDILALVDWRLRPDQALALPHVQADAGGAELEQHSGAEMLAGPLRARGQTVRLLPLLSNANLIARTPNGLAGATDSRGEGVARRP
jgi:gamma-glutamyltranspeptidase / glutathione hydrolase